MIGKILRMLVNTLTANDKYSLLNRDNLTQPIQMQLSQKHELFQIFFSQLFKSSLNFEYFQKKKMILIADSFWKLQTPKNVVRSTTKISRFWGPFEKQDGKRTQKLFKFEWQHLYHIYLSLRRQVRRRKPLLVIWKILGLFVNTVTTNDRYSLLNTDN